MTENKNKQTNVNDTVRRTQAAGGYSDVRIETVRFLYAFHFFKT